MNTDNKVEQLLTEGYEFEFGDYISKGWKILSQNAGTFIVYTFLSFLLLIVCLIIPIIGWLALFFAVGPALYAGYFLLAQQAVDEGTAELGTGFKGFKKIGRILPVFLLTMLIQILAAIPYYMVIGPDLYNFYTDFAADPEAMLGEQPPGAGWLGILQIIPYYFTVAYSFAIPFALFKDLGAWEAMEASRKIITKKWFIFFAFSLILSLIVGVGILLLFLGIFFTMSMFFTSTYVAFDDIVGVNEELSDDELDHLIA